MVPSGNSTSTVESGNDVVESSHQVHDGCSEVVQNEIMSKRLSLRRRY